MADLNDFIYTDDLDDVLAIYVNNLLASTMRSEYKNVETLSADKTLTDADTPIQRLDCNGAARIVKVPTADAVENHPFFIVNSSAGAYAITLKSNDGATTLATIEQGMSNLVVPDGAGTYKAIADNAAFSSHTANVSNPHSVTAAQVGVAPYTNSNNFYRNANPTAISRFDALINGTPTSAANSVVTFDTVTSGNMTSITPSATGQLAQMRLYNNTRGDYALIVSATGETVTLDRNVRTLANPWADNDVITNYKTTIGTGDGISFVELEIVEPSLQNRSAIFFEVACRSVTAGEILALHPYETYATAKSQYTIALIGGGSPLTTLRTVLIPVINNVIGIGWNGTAYTAIILKVEGYIS